MSDQGNPTNGETIQIKQETTENKETNDEIKSEEYITTQQKAQVKNGQTQIEEKTIKSQQFVLQNAKKQNETTKDKKQKGDKVELTQKEFKKMMKLANQVDNLKSEYEKLVKNYQLIRAEKDQLKKQVEQKNSKIKNLSNQIEELTNDEFFLKQQTDKSKRDNQTLKKENETLIKRLQDYKKTQQLKQALDQRVKQLQIIIDMTTKNAEQHKKTQDKLRKEQERQREFLKLQKESNSNLRNEVERLRIIESQTFIMKQELVRISTEYKNLKFEKEQFPIMVDKFEHQEQMISELKEKIKQYEVVLNQTKSTAEKLQKRITQVLDQKKQLERKHNKARCQIEQAKGESQALKAQLQEERGDWQVQKKRYLTQLKTLKTELHNQHEKLKITEWELSESRKKEKPKVQIERVSIVSLSKEDLLNYLEEMEMKNQSLKINLNQISHTIHEKDKVIKEQGKAIMSLTRELTKDYPNFIESEGMEYVEKDMIELGREKKDDWAEIVEKVMIENMRLKYSVTALGEQFNLQLRKQKEK